MQKRRPIRYKSNPARATMPRGRKVQDDVTGTWTYEEYLVRDKLGFLRDGRRFVTDSEDHRGGTRD